ncbi:hypothetical protein [Saccharothrix sp.]|uniref:hypothetical protein n=1 Tax=Saccharothrix sp. TaxID=1873460 RepID=UPI002811E8C3|nr:hypothetical protein [Saccharothrix sp.]
MRRVFLDAEGNLRPVVLVGLLVSVPAAVLALAAWGTWAAIVCAAGLLAAGLVAAVRYG